MAHQAERLLLRIGATGGLPEVLRELGFNPNQLIAEAGFDPKIFDSPDNRLSLTARGQLLERCANMTGCPHLGLLVGRLAGLESLGFVGLLAKHAPDVGTALRQLCRYFHLHAEGVAPHLSVDGGRAVFSYQILDHTVPGSEQSGDGAVAAILNILQELCGPDFKPSEALFAHARPENVAPYQRLLRVHLEFDSSIYALVFSSSWLARSLPSTDEGLLRLLQEKVVDLDRLLVRSFPERVQVVLRTAMPFDQTSATSLATLFAMNVRTFHRRLAEAGTSHQELLDQTRHGVACQLLADSRRSVAHIAELLGYAELRSFIRAFKRWTGTTPTQWRKNRKNAVKHQ